MALLAGVLACSTSHAPEAVTDVVRWFWRNHDTAADERVADGVVALNGTVTSVTAEEPLKQVVTSLLAGDVAWTGRAGVDPSVAPGMLVVTDLHCTLEQVLHFHTSPDQATLHPGTYTEFKRTFQQSRTDFLAHAIPQIGRAHV